MLLMCLTSSDSESRFVNNSDLTNIHCIAFKFHFKDNSQVLTLTMAGQSLKGILFMLFFASLCEVFVCGGALSQRATVSGCPICKLLKQLVNKQKVIETKIDLLLGAKANCSAGRKVVFWVLLKTEYLNKDFFLSETKSTKILQTFAVAYAFCGRHPHDPQDWKVFLLRENNKRTFYFLAKMMTLLGFSPVFKEWNLVFFRVSDCLRVMSRNKQETRSLNMQYSILIFNIQYSKNLRVRTCIFPS